MKNVESSEIALYRKYRPHTFKDVIGQDHIISVLQHSIAQGTISHAYLFGGSRGTGKTSIARIFARDIGTATQDVYEIDAASNRGIDDVREIRESVHTLPFESKYKVYIVDEVHMLTKEAFNALLKTLEEPPPYVVFILATTEIEKLPETVVSRCQTFTFKKPNQHMLAQVVSVVSKKEGFSIDASSSDLIALLGDGSFRDTLGVLQKVMSVSEDKKITIDEVERITGAPRAPLVQDVVYGIVYKDKEKSILAVHALVESGIDMTVCMKLILEKVRFLLLLRVAPALSKKIETSISAEDFSWLSNVAQAPNTYISSSVLVALLSAYEQTSRAYIAHLPLELAIIDICSVE